MISIQLELPEHQAAIRHLTETAFAASEFGHSGEADLIDALRTASDQTLSLVAIQAAKVVGHILFTPVSIRCRNQKCEGMGLAPLSVMPTLQRSGIGSQLVTAGLRQLSSINTAFTVVAGHPDFYLRFGFVPAADFGITHGFANMPQDIFLIHADDRRSLHPVRGGRAYYLPEFGPQHNSDV